MKVLNNPSNAVLNQIINNQDPSFDSINTSKNYYDFHLKTDSPAIDAGIATPVIYRPRWKATACRSFRTWDALSYNF